VYVYVHVCVCVCVCACVCACVVCDELSAKKYEEGCEEYVVRCMYPPPHTLRRRIHAAGVRRVRGSSAILLTPTQYQTKLNLLNPKHIRGSCPNPENLNMCLIGPTWMGLVFFFCALTPKPSKGLELGQDGMLVPLN
jgi:hypothetical protein